jgi:hypothetical protein
LFLTKAIANQYDLGEEIWDERHLQKRTKELCEKIIIFGLHNSDQAIKHDKSNGMPMNIF